MSWGEAYRLTTVLLSDPSSHVAAAVAGWDHPVSREWLVLADVYDLTARVAAGKKWKAKDAYPRPVPKRRFGKGMPRDQLVALLAEHRGQ